MQIVERNGLRVIDCEQGTREWYMARAGRVTGSRISDIQAKIKSGPSASRMNYLCQLVAERLTGEPTPPGYESAEMKWGKLYEPMARNTYALLNDVSPQTIGFVVHPKIDMAGASPDSLIGDDGLTEIKCPNTATHIKTLEGAPIDGGYMLQMQWQMACTGRKWCDYISFDPRLPAEMQLFVKRVPRDDGFIRDLDVDIRQFLGEVDAKVRALKARFRVKEAA